MHYPNGNIHSCVSEQDIKSISWQPHFCFLPRRLENGRLAWLETVYKRKSKMHLSRYPDHSPGVFRSIVKFKKYVFIDRYEFMIEKLKGDDEPFAKVQHLFRKHRTGHFRIW
jgi:hypothetical protein